MIPSHCDSLLVGPAECFDRPLEGMACQFWNDLDKDQAAQILWDLDADMNKGEAFVAAVSRAAFACFACDVNGNPKGCAWLIPTGQGSRTSAAHFAFAGWLTRNEQLYAGQEFLRLARRHADLLIGLIPKPWAGARAYCKQLGFEHGADFPKACRIGRFNRCVDGEFLFYKFKDGKHAER